MSRAWTKKVPLQTVTLFVALTATMPAHSQQESVAESLFRRAREEMKRNEPAAACPKFEESYRLDPSIGTLLNLALCEEALGHTATAWTKLRQFLDLAPTGDDRLPLAREEIERLESQLPWLRLVVEQNDEKLLVELDGVELRNASLSQAIPVNPGEHLVRVTRSTGESNETPFRILATEKLDLRVSLPARRPPAPAPAVSTPTSAQQVEQPIPKPNASGTSSHGRTERAVAYGVGAVGVAGLVTGGVFGLMAIHDRNVVRDHCPNHECQDQTGLDAVESGARNQTIATVAFAVGAIGLATGGVMLWHSGRASATVTAGPHGGCVFWVGAF